MTAQLPLIDEERRFVMFWTPRCGSTTALIWFFHTIGLGRELSGKSAHALRTEWIKQNPTYQHLEEIYKNTAYFRFVVCRDPIDRCVSSYYLALTSPPASQWKEIAARKPEYNETERLTFLEFLDYLSETNLDTCDLHWRRQSAQDWARQDININKFVRVESLQDDFDCLNKKFNVSSPIKIASSTPKTGLQVDEDVTQMRLSQLEATFGRDDHGKLLLPHHKAFLSDGVESRIRQLYARDIDLLGY